MCGDTNHAIGLASAFRASMSPCVRSYDVVRWSPTRLRFSPYLNLQQSTQSRRRGRPIARCCCSPDPTCQEPTLRRYAPWVLESAATLSRRWRRVILLPSRCETSSSPLSRFANFLQLLELSVAPRVLHLPDHSHDLLASGSVAFIPTLALAPHLQICKSSFRVAASPTQPEPWSRWIQLSCAFLLVFQIRSTSSSIAPLFSRPRHVAAVLMSSDAYASIGPAAGFGFFPPGVLLLPVAAYHPSRSCDKSLLNGPVSIPWSPF